RAWAEERIRSLCSYDSLTGLPNRLLFTDRLVLALAAARRTGRALAILSLDLDNFKRINETFGHAAGDRLLEIFANRLGGQIRSSDTAARPSAIDPQSSV